MRTWRSTAKPPSEKLLVREKDNAAESELFFRRVLFVLFAIFLALLSVSGRLVYLQVLNLSLIHI